jgi:hypothetical protein
MNYISDITRCTKPGGWIEHLEFSIKFQSDDDTITEDHILATWDKIFIEAGEKMGKSLAICETMKEDIIKAGFVNVKEKKYKLPVGPWSSDPKLKELGAWNLLYMLQGLEGMALYVLTEVMKVGISLLL